jgi:hypothetical protein
VRREQREDYKLLKHNGREMDDYEEESFSLGECDIFMTVPSRNKTVKLHRVDPQWM